MRRLLCQLKAAFHELNMEESDQLVGDIKIVSSEDMAEMARMNEMMA